MKRILRIRNATCQRGWNLQQVTSPYELRFERRCAIARAQRPPGMTGLYERDHFLPSIEMACRSPRVAINPPNEALSEPGRMSEYESPRRKAIDEVRFGHSLGPGNGCSREWSYGHIMTSM